MMAERGENAMTASGGNIIGFEVRRNKRSPLWGAALIESAEGIDPTVDCCMN